MKYLTVLLILLSLSTYSQTPNKITVSNCFYTPANGNYTKVNSPCDDCSIYYEKDGSPIEQIGGRAPTWNYENNTSFPCPDMEGGIFQLRPLNCGNILCPGGSGCWNNCTIIENTTAPVEMKSFLVSLQDGLPKLEWVTASEINNDYFEVQRSLNGSTWKTIELVQGNGTTHEELSYEFIDKNVIQGIYYYRLKQVDYDGSFEYSRVLTVDVNNYKESGGLKIFPNPITQQEIKMEIPFSNGSQSSVVVRNMNGEVVLKKTFTGNKKVEQLSLGLFPKGMYYLSLNGENQTYSSKVLVD